MKKKNCYEAPLLELLEICVEAGFATSTEVGVNNPENPFGGGSGWGEEEGETEL